MKVAIVHELLTMRGGAERVLRILADMFPDAPIYTLLYDEKKLGDWFPRSRVIPSNLQRHAWFSTNHHLYLPSFPQATEAWDFSGYNLVISSSSAFAHGIITNGAPKHLCYVHSPARYLWDRTHDVLEQTSEGLLGSIKHAYLSKLFHRLRLWDAEAAYRPDVLLAASQEVQRRIELYWRRESDVLYPPLDDMWLEKETEETDETEDRQTSTSYKLKAKSYYLIVSTLSRYKRIDLAIEAAKRGKRHLKIVGEGADAGRLRSLAGPTVEFLGYKSHEELKDLYANARATIFPGDEDFGLVPLESMSCGTPVIAYGSGGALETVQEGITGEFFFEPSVDALETTVGFFENQNYDREACKKQAQKFTRQKFEEGIKTAIDRL